VKQQAREYGWTGLNTRANAFGLEPLECPEFQDVVVKGRDFTRRDGFSRAGVLAPGDLKAMDFDSGSSEAIAVPIDTRAWAMGTQFTIECLVELDGTGDNQAVFYAGATTPTMALDTSSTNWRWRVWDSAGTLTTVTVGTAAASVQSIQLIRDGSSLTTRLNNAAGGTGTMSATLSTRTPVGDLRIARNGGSDYLDGTIDYLRGFGVVRSSHNDRLLRFPDPCASYVLFDYDFNADGTTVLDRSVFENHGVAANTPTEVASLCHNYAPIRALRMYVDHQNQKYLAVQASGTVYLVPVD
jgi:hypothetical protein